MFSSAEEVLAFIAEEQVEFIDVRFCDLPGTIQHFTVPVSTFDEDVIIEACRQFDTALEVNCRPERLDPPKRILSKAVEAGLRIAISTDAHATDQLEWQPYGTDRAAECGVTAEQVVNAMSADDLLEWCGSHPTP